MVSVASAGERTDFVVRTLEPVLHEPRAIQFDFVDELDVGGAAPARHQRRRSTPSSWLMMTL